MESNRCFFCGSSGRNTEKKHEDTLRFAARKKFQRFEGIFIFGATSLFVLMIKNSTIIFKNPILQLMVNCWFGLVVWIPGIPLWKGLLLGCTHRAPNQQLAISWILSIQDFMQS